MMRSTAFLRLFLPILTSGLLWMPTPLSAFQQVRQQGTPVLGETHSATLPPGIVDRWTIEVAENERLEISVEQIDTDLVIRVFRPDGELELEVDGPSPQGPEGIIWVTSSAGAWTLEVAAFRAELGGRYSIWFETRRPATERDRRLHRAERLNQEGMRAYGAGDYAVAEDRFLEVIGLLDVLYPGPHRDQGAVLNNLGVVYETQGRFAEAEPNYLRAIQIHEDLLGPDHPDLADNLDNLAGLYGNQEGRLAEAEKLYERALAIREAAFGPNHRDVALSLQNLATLHSRQARFDEAERLYRRALAIQEAERGPDHPAVADILDNQAVMYDQQGRFQEAELRYSRALEIRENAFGPHHPDVALSLNNLAELRRRQGRLGDAEALHLRALEIRESAFGPNHPLVANSLNNLAVLYEGQGRHADAEIRQLRALEIQENALGPSHPEVALSLDNLAAVYTEQGRDDESEPLRLRALEIYEEAWGPDHPSVALSLLGLGAHYRLQGRYDEAEVRYVRAVDILEQVYGGEHRDLASGLSGLGLLYHNQKRFSEAEPLYRRAIEIKERLLGPKHSSLATSLHNLAKLSYDEGRDAQAELLFDRAIGILDATPAAPGVKALSLASRALLHHRAGRSSEAMADLERSLTVVDRLRPRSALGDQTRALFFGQYKEYFDRMVTWQIEAGDLSAALEYAERSRARVLLDQLAAGQVDLRESIPPDLRAQLEERESNAGALLAEYQQRTTLLRSRTDLSADEMGTRIASVQDSLRLAEEEYTRVYQDIKDASPLWRELITSGGEPVTLEEVQEELVPENGLMLIYQIGSSASHLLLVPPRQEEVQAHLLTIGEEEAARLGVDAGALTSERLNLIVGGRDDKPGVVPSSRGSVGRSGVAGVRSGATPTARLHATWRVLIPEAVWSRIRDASEVVVIPDGGLNYLPFETLVVNPDSGSSPRFWLDDGPPIRYAASTSTLHSLTRRPEVASEGLGILSVSDPIYDPGEVAAEAGVPEGLLDRQSMTQASRFGYERGGGSLARLPGTARETSLIQAAFGRSAVTVLRRAGAGEGSVREALSGKRYLHLATHGLVEEGRSSLFASLALTPPPGETADPDDDGFLQLHEVYGLQLADVDLAVLSACDTNVGERVEGEGVFALSRGFIAAGARRVVASQWAVNDDSTAELIGALFGSIAQSERAGRSIDYATALRDAKLVVRNHPDHPEWADPYFWAPFVLTGKR